jgi:hypothetical protein
MEVVSFKPRLLYTMGNSPNAVEKRMSVFLAGNRNQAFKPEAVPIDISRLPCLKYVLVVFQDNCPSLASPAASLHPRETVAL